MKSDELSSARTQNLERTKARSECIKKYFSSPSKGEARWGRGSMNHALRITDNGPHPHPGPPLEGLEGEGELALAPSLATSHLFAFGFHIPITAPVGSWMMLSQPASITSMTSLITVAPSDFAF